MAFFRGKKLFINAECEVQNAEYTLHSALPTLHLVDSFALTTLHLFLWYTRENYFIYMARIYNQNTLKILQAIGAAPGITGRELARECQGTQSSKDFYNTLYRLAQQEIIEQKGAGMSLSAEGSKILGRLKPERDGIWKLVLFDIPERQKKVRIILRAKLKALGFVKWQNSIWISPFKLDEEIEQELNELGKKFFIRLIKTTDINHTEDLEKLFKN